MLSSLYMGNPAPLDPRLVQLISDIQWIAYRIFGITSQLKSPGLESQEDAWDWHRPWFCFHLHYGRHDTSERSTMAPLHFRCERMKSALIRLGNRAPAFGKCGTGLRLIAIPLILKDSTIASLILGPYSSQPIPDTFSRNIARQTGFDDPEHLSWCARQIPVLSRQEEDEMLSWFTLSIRRMLARFGCLQDGASWEEAIGTAWEPLYSPVRMGDDSPASIFGVFSWPFETEPSLTPAATRGNFWELLFVERGKLLIKSGETIISLNAGQAFLLPPGTSYTVIRSSLPAAGIQITFIGQAGIFSSLTMKPLTLRARDKEDLQDICTILFASPEGSRNSTVRINLLHLLLNLRQGFSIPGNDLSLTGPASRDRRHSAIADARRYIEEHAAESLSIDALARHCETSVSTIAHTFKELTGISPFQYHLRVKFEMAKTMLREGWSVTSVAEKLGFADTAHFSRNFKKNAGTSPSRFSRSVRPPPGRKPA